MFKLQGFFNKDDDEKMQNSWKIARNYFIFGVLWIVFSDNIINYLVKDVGLYKKMQMQKSLFFIVITAIILYIMIKLYCSKILNLSNKVDVQKKYIYEIYNSINSAIIIWNLNGEVIEINNYFKKLLGYEDDEIIGKEWIKLIIPQQEKFKMENVIAQMQLKEKIINGENDVITKDNRILNMMWNNTFMENYGEYESVIVSFGIDITKELNQEKKINRIAYEDNLTGLKNKEMFEIDVNDLIKNKEPFAIYLLDIDNFKKLNDIHGYDYGDLFLKQYAEMLIKKLENVNIYRWSGDKFSIIEKINLSQETEKTLNYLMRNNKKKWELGNVEFHYTISIGVTSFPMDGDNVFTLLQNAEMALNKAKSMGKDRYEFYESELQKQFKFQTKVEQEIDRAILNNEFQLNFQPIYDLKTEQIASAEILLRLYSEKLPNTNIGQIITIAEQSGQINNIDKWVVKEAFKNIKENFEQETKCTFCINLSAQSFNSEEFIEFIKEQIDIFKINTKLIEFEITEYSFLNDLDKSVKMMNSLKLMGFKIALDDFGTRYSSLNYLAKLPFDRLKIDKSYVDNIVECNNEQIVVEQIIQLANKLGLKTIAEGIELREQKEFLLKHGCDYGQGYYFSKPIKLELLLKLMKI